MLPIASYRPAQASSPVVIVCIRWYPVNDVCRFGPNPAAIVAAVVGDENPNPYLLFVKRGGEIACCASSFSGKDLPS